MDVLKYKTVIATEGALTVSTGGLNLAQIIKVSRQGDQKDYVGFLSYPTMTGNQWTFGTIFGVKRILFATDFPFGPNENIYIMYKVTV